MKLKCERLTKMGDFSNKGAQRVNLLKQKYTECDLGTFLPFRTTHPHVFFLHYVPHGDISSHRQNNFTQEIAPLTVQLR